LYVGALKARRKKRNCCCYCYKYWWIELNELYMAMLRDELNEWRCRQALPFVHTHYINTHTQFKECWEQEKNGVANIISSYIKKQHLLNRESIRFILLLNIECHLALAESTETKWYHIST
jgi:hypothetical protein